MGMKIDFNATPCQKSIPTCTRSATEMTIIDLEVQKLLSKHVIEPTGHCHQEIISNVFVRGKKDGSHGKILNPPQHHHETCRKGLSYGVY